MEQVAEFINEQGEGEVIFTSLDMNYANGITPRDGKALQLPDGGRRSYWNIPVDNGLLRVDDNAN